MSYMSDILDKANAINPKSTASDLYLFAKAISDAGISDVPKAFVKAVKARFLNAETSDPNELAYLQKILNFTNAWALQGAWCMGDGIVRTIGNGINTYPAQSIADLLLPQQVVIYSNPGTYDFLLANRNKIPGWYKDNSLFRVRVWGAGGSGARIVSTGSPCALTGGGGGGYAEGLLTLAQIKSNPALSVGQGGILVGTGAGSPGQVSSFGGQLVGSGGLGGAYNSSIGAAGGTGAGASALYVSSGGSGGANLSINSGTWWFFGGSGGGAAGGPWGNGGNGGDITSNSCNSNGGGGGGTGSSGLSSGQTSTGAPATGGGNSAVYQDKWKTEYLQQMGGAAGSNSAKNGGFGAGGAGGSFISDGHNSTSKAMISGGHGGAFGGGGGVGAAGFSVNGSSETIFAGNGGVAAGGGAAVGNSADATSGNGGNGLIIVEWFV